MAIAKAVKELREFLDWSQQQLADKAIVSQGAISRLESGNHGNVPLHTVVVVFRALATGAVNRDLVPSTPARHLIAFTKTLDDSFTITDHVDRKLLTVIRIFNNLSPQAQQGLVDFLAATREPAREFVTL
jgi:transcriptional regulator with XRE-family HTH domain